MSDFNDPADPEIDHNARALFWRLVIAVDVFVICGLVLWLT